MNPSSICTSLIERPALGAPREVGPQKHEYRSKTRFSSLVALVEAPSLRAFEDRSMRRFVLLRTEGGRR